MTSIFKPAWWLPGPHLQTLWPVFLRRRKLINNHPERLELPDGDFIDLVWVGNKEKRPLVVVLHGLNGGINSHYINGILHAIEQDDWCGVLMHFRGCGGEPNRLAKSYHSGETGDLEFLISELVRRDPDTTIFILGYSLGGNVLLKALGTCDFPVQVKSAIAISVPFELNKTADHMSKGFARIYQSHLVRGLIRNYKRKFNKLSSPLHVTGLNKMRTFWEFDHAVTAPLHGFNSAADYYKKSSSRKFLNKINIPTLILHSLDDPFTSLSSLPQPLEVSKLVVLKVSSSGGHVGFVMGQYPWKPIYWLEQQIIEFFSKHT